MSFTAFPGEDGSWFVEVDDRDGGLDSENFSFLLLILRIKSMNGAVEVWFTNGEAQDTNIDVNDPPQIDMLRLSRTAVIPGQDVDITGQASDPENMDADVVVVLDRRNVEETGTASGNNISLPDMDTSDNVIPIKIHMYLRQ